MGNLFATRDLPAPCEYCSEDNRTCDKRRKIPVENKMGLESLGVIIMIMQCFSF